MNKIPVFYGIDDKYVPFAAASLQSLKENTNSPIKVTVLYESLTEDNQHKLSKISNDDFEIQFCELSQEFQKAFGGDKNTLRADYLTFTIYYRIFISKLFPDIDKAIYLDADTIINADIKEMYDIELGDNLIGAIPDSFICNDKDAQIYASEGIGVEKDRYVNSGVLLMNLKLMRELSFSEHFLQLLNKYHFDLIAPDQDYINVICRDRLLLLDTIWNYQTEFILPEVGEPKIVHYNLYGKPWNYDDVPFGDLFWKYSQETEFYNQAKEIKANYSKEDQENDRIHKEKLVNKIKMIPGTELTFKSMNDDGEKICI